MKIKWLGHSSFLLEESTGTSIVTDPYEGDYVGIPYPKVRADIVTVSHPHHDHNAARLVEGSPRVIDGVGFWEIDGVYVNPLESCHDHHGGLRRGKSLICKFRLDGVEVVHMGDIGEEITPQLGEAIGPVNVLLIPVGDNYTIGAEEAKEYVDFLMPDIVIPMHYKTPSCRLDIDKLRPFLQLFEDEQIRYVEGDEIELDREDFDGESTRVIVFDGDRF